MMLEHLGEKDAAARLMRGGRARHRPTGILHARSRRQGDDQAGDRRRGRRDPQFEYLNVSRA